MECATIELERNYVIYESKELRIVDSAELFGIKYIQISIKPSKTVLSQSSAVLGAIIAAATTCVGGYSTLTVKVRQHASHPPTFTHDMVLDKVGCFPRFCLHKQLLAIDDQIIEDRIDYHRNRLKCSTDSVFIFRGIVVEKIAKNKHLLPPPRPIKRIKTNEYLN